MSREELNEYVIDSLKRRLSERSTPIRLTTDAVDVLGKSGIAKNAFQFDAYSAVVLMSKSEIPSFPRAKNIGNTESNESFHVRDASRLRKRRGVSRLVVHKVFNSLLTSKGTKSDLSIVKALRVVPPPHYRESSAFRSGFVRIHVRPEKRIDISIEIMYRALALSAVSGVVDERGVREAMEKICPLWPFC